MRCNGESLTTGPAKLPVRRHGSPTGRAGLFERCAALLAEADLFAVLNLASWTHLAVQDRATKSENRRLFEEILFKGKELGNRSEALSRNDVDIRSVGI